MIVKWSFFGAAAFFASYMLISRGVPILPVLVGCGLAAVMTWRMISRHSTQNR